MQRGYDIFPPRLMLYGADVKVFGYQRDSEILIELKEVTFQADIKELNKIIKFLENVRKEHGKVIVKEELCHSHFCDWDIEWKPGAADIIVVTGSKGQNGSTND